MQKTGVVGLYFFRM